jgi:hypothetical protein
MCAIQPATAAEQLMRWRVYAELARAVESAVNPLAGGHRT